MNMANKKCPIKAMGNKPCTDDCALATPIGCSIKIIADQLIIMAVAKTKAVAKKEKKDAH
jgi:hypothetical protein